MSKSYTQAGIVKFDSIGKPSTSLYNGGEKVTRIFFNTVGYGRLEYYETEKKLLNEGHMQFHKDILDSSYGKNSGYYVGLTIERKKKNPDNYFIEFNPKYKVLSHEEVKELNII